jgi:hypothetical protein
VPDDIDAVVFRILEMVAKVLQDVPELSIGDDLSPASNTV